MRTFIPLQPPTLQQEWSDPNYRYREYAPGDSLKPYVACYWTVDFRASGSSRLHRIIPDGCVDIIFDLRSPSFAKGGFVAGLMTGFEAMNLSGEHSLFGIRFHSDTVRRFISYPVSEFTGTGHHVYLEHIWGNHALMLTEQIMASNGTAEIIEQVEDALLQRLIRSESDTDDLLFTSMQYIYASQGLISIRSLAEHLNYSERNIRRTFQRELGAGPKEFAGIVRFQYLLQELYRGSQSRLTDLAAKYGYYDQPHFIHHFKRYYGLSPNQVFKASTEMK